MVSGSKPNVSCIFLMARGDVVWKQNEFSQQLSATGGRSPAY